MLEIDEGSILSNNTRGLGTSGEAHVIITGGSKVIANSALFGFSRGGLLIGGQATAVISGGSSVIAGNSAGPGGGSVSVGGASSLVLDGVTLRVSSRSGRT